MVLDLCRTLLPDAADAADAFRATFLVLARKAGSIRKVGSPVSWPYGVAHRVARRAQAAFARRRPSDVCRSSERSS
jgi:RNA polymerase sigma-70 factor (ECF subfamily)